MNLVDRIVTQFRISDFSKDTSGVTWFTTGNVDLRELAAFMAESGARFVTITATELPQNQGICFEYLWDFEGHLLGFAFYPSGKTMPSIYDICEAADWIEREIHEEFAVDFTGRVYEPLLLREGDLPGVNLHEVAK